MFSASNCTWHGKTRCETKYNVDSLSASHSGLSGLLQSTQHLVLSVDQLLLRCRIESIHTIRRTIRYYPYSSVLTREFEKSGMTMEKLQNLKCDQNHLEDSLFVVTRASLERSIDFSKLWSKVVKTWCTFCLQFQPARELQIWWRRCRKLA